MVCAPGHWDLFLDKKEKVEDKHSEYSISNFLLFVPTGKEMERVFGLLIFRGLTRLETFHTKQYLSFFCPLIRQQKNPWSTWNECWEKQTKRTGLPSFIVAEEAKWLTLSFHILFTNRLPSSGRAWTGFPSWPRRPLMRLFVKI